MISTVNRKFYMTLRKILIFMGKGLFLLRGNRVEGKQHLPRTRQPCILIANHAAFFDSIFIIFSVRPRFTICGAKPKYFSTFFKRIIFMTANILKVESKNQFLSDCGELLKSGEIILIYPEMGRNPSGLGDFKTWAAEVAIAQKVPVIPCYLYGTTHGQAGPNRLFVGRAISPRGNAEELTEEFRKTIWSLKPGNGKE